MIDNFPAFAALMHKNVQNILAAHRFVVFVVDLSSDDLYGQYLAAFPRGTNPIFKTNTEHDCSTCKQFIRRVGGLIMVDAQGEVVTAWDLAAQTAGEPYRAVAETMRAAVRGARIDDLFCVDEKELEFGARVTRAMQPDGTVREHGHLYTGAIPAAFRSSTPDKVRGDYKTTMQVFERGLTELKPAAIETVLGLVEANTLYRGAEHKTALQSFQSAQNRFLQTGGRARDVFVWLNASGPASRFRNTAIGTLVQDLSEGIELERAVRSFEAKVAPENYKRTTALVTPGMVTAAMATIAELGLESALERRFAKFDDLAVRDVLWVDGSVKPLMKGGLGDVLMAHALASTTKSADDVSKGAEVIALDALIANVLPTATAMELFFKGSQVGNLMTFTAPVHPEPKELFRWSGDMAWVYSGNVADSIRERVKAAGGRVEGAALRVSLSWFNHDDLDLHIREPAGRGIHAFAGHISYMQKRGWTGGQLDVDMNAGSGTTRTPVENVAWVTAPPDGAYNVTINNFSKREDSNVGFVVEIECAGKLTHYSYTKALRTKEDVHVVTLHMKGGVIDRVENGNPGITASNISQERWGLATERWAKVNCVTLSPNYFGDNAVGNKHTFFVLDGAASDEPMRGICNEFLHPRLEQHRRVFEIIGEKTKCQPTPGQLCGLGFSSTKPDAVLVRVTAGKKQRVYNVQVANNRALIGA